MIGGLSTFDLPEDFESSDPALARESKGMGEYLMPPLPNTLYTRDTTCWIYNGVTLNPLYSPARQSETPLMKAIYTFHAPSLGAATRYTPDRGHQHATTALHRRHDVVGRSGTELGPGHARGRRRHADRQRG